MSIKIIFFVLFFILEIQALSTSQLKLVKSLSEESSRKQIVVIKNVLEQTNKFKLVKIVKCLSSFNMYTSFQSVTDFGSDIRKLRDFYENKTEHYPRTIAIIDNDELLEVAISYFSDEFKFATAKVTWIVFNDNEIDFEVDFFNNVIPYNCEFFSINQINNSSYEILEIYSMNHVDPDFSVTYYGTWNETTGLDVPVKDFYARRFDLNGTILGIPVAWDCWHSVTRDIACSAIYRTNAIRIQQEIGRIMNFGCELIFMEYGYEDNALEIFKENFPFSFVGFGTYILEANDYFAFSYFCLVIWKIRFYLHVGYNKIYETGMSSPFIRPFSLNLWFSIGAWILVSTLFILFINYHAYQYQNSSENFSLLDSCFISFESFTNQCGTSVCPKAQSSRITLFTILIPPLFLVWAYSAIVISFITVRIIQLPFNNLEDFIKDGTFKIGYVKDSSPKFWFQDSKDATTRSIYETFIIDEEEMPQNAVEGVSRMCDDHKFSFISYNDLLFQYNFECQPLQIPYVLFKTNAAMAVRPYSPYIKIFSRIINSIRSSGTLNGLQTRIYNIDKKTGLLAENSKNFLKTKKFDIDTVDWNAVESIFILLMIACVISMALLLLERCIFQKLHLKKFFFKSRRNDSKIFKRVKLSPKQNTFNNIFKNENM